jgi:hypothetical protein
VNDTTPPTIRLVDVSPYQVILFSVFNDPGITVTDNIDAKVTNVSVLGVSNVNTSAITPTDAPIIITYFATDASGNVASRNRSVFVYDPCPATATPMPASWAACLGQRRRRWRSCLSRTSRRQ